MSDKREYQVNGSLWWIGFRLGWGFAVGVAWACFLLMVGALLAHWLFA